MKTQAARRTKGGPEHRTINGRRVVILDLAEYDRLRERADEWEPLMPEPDVEGNYPAVEYARASLARKIVRHRRRVGLTQTELARKAGIRVETLNRIEHGRNTPTLATVEKIERALKSAGEPNHERHDGRRG